MNIKLKIRRIYFLLRWKFAFVFLSKKDVHEATPINIIDKEEIENPLILVPHADDEWIGCSQILKESPRVTLYYFNFLGNNYSEENRKVRLAELKSLQEKLGFRLMVSEENQPHLDLMKLIEENHFSSIFLPCPIDWHPEHILVNSILKDVLCKISFLKQLYLYNVSVPLPNKLEMVFSPMNKEAVKEKQEIFNKHYPSQKNVSIRRLVLQNRLSAYNSNFFAIEPYGKLNFKTWLQLMDYIEKYFPTDVQPLIHIIDYPVKIRKIVNNVFDKFLKYTEIQ